MSTSPKGGQSPKASVGSKAAAMRAQLQMKAKEREDFEVKNKQLIAEMESEKLKLGAIRQGLRNNEVNYVPADGEMTPKQESFNHMNDSQGILMSSNAPSPSQKSLSHKKTASSSLNLKSMPSSTSVTAHSSMKDVRPPPIPSGPKISDWCYTGALDSVPPTVRSNTLYETIRLLGRGAFGDVNLVKVNGEVKLYAMKTIFSEKESHMTQTLQEVRFLRANRHPCIIDVYDIFLSEKPRILHIIMPFCEAGDLNNQITTAKKNNSFLPEANVLKWMMQVALGLQHMHKNNTIHRDIKPNNIMLTDGGELAKICDFGLALELKDGRCEITAEGGTPLYYPPEMVKGLPYGFSADCWSLGVMIHELLALNRPFNGATITDLASAIMNEKPPNIPPHYSAEMKTLVEGLLAKDPSDRLSMSGMLSDPLFASRVSTFASSGYRPKMLEERLRRAHVRQLQSQIEQIMSSNQSLIHTNSLLNSQSLVVEDATPVIEQDLLTTTAMNTNTIIINAIEGDVSTTNLDSSMAASITSTTTTTIGVLEGSLTLPMFSSQSPPNELSTISDKMSPALSINIPSNYDSHNSSMHVDTSTVTTSNEVLNNEVEVGASNNQLLSRHATPLPTDFSLMTTTTNNASTTQQREAKQMPTLNEMAISDSESESALTSPVQQQPQQQGHQHNVLLEDILTTTPYGGKKGQAISEAIEYSTSTTTKSLSSKSQKSNIASSLGKIEE